MEFLIVVIAFLVVLYLSLRFGYDSRAVPYSKEHELAQHGMIWEVRGSHLEDLRHEAAMWRTARQVAQRRGRIRRRVALALRAFAYWLSPELTTQMSD